MSLSSNDALKKLLDGNERYVHGSTHTLQPQPEQRATLLKGQTPFAIILCCSDSRVTPEIIFDQGLGDLFVIRIAGNSASVEAIASIEYAVAYLHSPLVVVLGHTQCGAVTAAVKGTPTEGQLPKLLSTLQPAIAAHKTTDKDIVNTVACTHATMTMNILTKSKPILNQAIATNTLKIVAGLYDLATGSVKILP